MMKTANDHQPDSQVNGICKPLFDFPHCTNEACLEIVVWDISQDNDRLFYKTMNKLGLISQDNMPDIDK